MNASSQSYVVLEPLVLLCTACYRQHIDEGDLSVDPHTDHVCLYCGHEWRPRKHATVGVPLGGEPRAWLAAMSMKYGIETMVRHRLAWKQRNIARSVPMIIPPPPMFGVAAKRPRSLREGYFNAVEYDTHPGTSDHRRPKMIGRHMITHEAYHAHPSGKEPKPRRAQ